MIICGIFSGCRKDSNIRESVTDIPSDFIFSLRWNVFGISSYDSATGELIKSSHSMNPDDYVTTLILSEEQKEAVRRILSTIDFTKYPAEYNPDDNSLTIPPNFFILTVQYEDSNYSISCMNAIPSYAVKSKEGRFFLSACESIADIITDTDEWKVLPDYDTFYE